MAPTKIYELSTTNLKRTKAELREENSKTAAYEIDLSFGLSDLRSAKPGRHGIILRKPASSASDKQSSQVLGTCDFNFVSSMSRPIHLGFGDVLANSPSVIWEDMIVREKWKQTGFEISIDLGDGIGRKTFDWKRTHDVEGKGVLSKKLDMFNLKFVESETELVVARFVHNYMFGSKRGRFEIEAYEGGSDWEAVVILSGLATLDYMRKAQGWSF